MKFVNSKTLSSILFFLCFSLLVIAQNSSSEKKISLNLEKCIELTLKNNNTRNLHAYSVKVAEARLKLAESGKYPSVELTALASRIDQDPNYIVPESKIQMPALNFGTLNLPPLVFPVPLQDIKLADKQNVQADLNIIYPIYTGGKITSYIKQAEAGIAIAKNDSKANDDQIIYETKKLYYASLMAINLEEIARETMERLNTTLSVTESLYQNGSGRVTKVDFLKNKLIVEAIKTLTEQISGEKKSALDALTYTIGLDWDTEIELTESEIPFVPNVKPMRDLIEEMISGNPMFAKVDNAFSVYSAKINQAESDYYPSFALIGNYRRIFNRYDYGMVTPQNKNVWMVGIGMSMNIFSGFRTNAQIEENKAELDKINEQKKILTKGYTLKLQYLHNKLTSAANKENSSKEAMNSAIESRELIEKAYFSDIMELQDLLQAQLTEAFFKAQYHLILFEHADLKAQLENLLSNYHKN